MSADGRTASKQCAALSTARACHLACICTALCLLHALLGVGVEQHHHCSTHGCKTRQGAHGVTLVLIECTHCC
jgi:hypothetical protein